MNNNTTAVDIEKVDNTFTTVFNPASNKSLSDILKLLIIREI